MHRRLDHIHDDKLAKMCKNQLLKGLPKKFPKNLHNHRRDCWICPRGPLHNYQYNGAYNKWTGSVLHISARSHSDIPYLAMRLSGYNNCPSQACYKILCLGMCYLYHHPMVPIMYSSKKVNENKPLCYHFAKGEAEISNYDYTAHSGLEGWSDADFSRDVLARRSTTSTEHNYNETSIAWQCTKQAEPGGSVNEAETRSLSQASRKTIWYRSIMQSLNAPQPGPIPIFEDNKATITQVLNDRLTPVYAVLMF